MDKAETIIMRKYLTFILLSSFFVACSEDNEKKKTEEFVEDVVGEELTIERADKAQKVFQTIPSPFETASIFEEAGVSYNNVLTNPIENVSMYTTSFQQAINLGVYGADLSYANVHDQSQQCMLYMNSCKKMADALGISSAFSTETVERIEKNINDRDSLMTIINDAFWICDAYLKENGQNYMSALIISGGWIEGLYLGTRSLDSENPSEQLMQRIADQKYSLTNLTDLLKTYKNEGSVDLLNKMEDLKTAYNKIEEVKGEATVTEGDIPTIGGGSTLKYTRENIIEIATAVEKIRNEIIQ